MAGIAMLLGVLAVIALFHGVWNIGDDEQPPPRTNVNPRDMQQARQFLNELPAATAALRSR